MTKALLSRSSQAFQGDDAKEYRWIALIGAVLMACVSCCCAQSADPPTARCNALAGMDFSNIQDAPTQIVAAKVVESAGSDPAYCQVTGYIWPQVGFELRLPLTAWNGKFFEVGCGGACGNLGWAGWCPLGRGYACIASDMGHRGKGQDMLWAYQNWQAQLDFDIRGAHVAALAGKGITGRFYEMTPRKSYFMGCSNGGTQGLAEAQRFPWDFDGIVALAGVPNMSDMNTTYLWGVRALSREDGEPVLSREDLQIVHQAALARCDMDDGVRDGIIGDPQRCAFDPVEAVCKAGAKRGCLTPQQAQAVRDVYSGPVTSQGERKFFMRGSMPGSELGWVDASGLDYVATGPALGGLEEWALEVFRYMSFSPAPGPSWNLSDFDFERDYKRLGVSLTFWDASNPDLRKFKAAGGKLIVGQGWNDQNVVPTGNVDYYQTVEKTMGGRASTQDFFRLFMIPGMNHCTGGDGAFAIDYVHYIEEWVEQGRVPDKLIGAHVDRDYLIESSLIDGKQQGEIVGAFRLKFPLDPAVPITFTRPIYPYPMRAVYKGKGNPDNAGNFRRAEP